MNATLYVPPQYSSSPRFVSSWSLAVGYNAKLFQNDEAEALRSWRSALDRIYYHNAYRVTPSYRPQTETDKALQDSLKSMELQCKERVEILEALRDSRKEAQDNKTKVVEDHSNSQQSGTSTQHSSGFIGQGTIPAVNYPDLAKPAPPLPRRPVPVATQSFSDSHQPPEPEPRTSSSSNMQRPASIPTPIVLPKSSRTPSPDKRSKMKTTLRTGKDHKNRPKNKDATLKRPPVASTAAGLAWDSNSRDSLSRPSSQAQSQPPQSSTLNLFAPQSSNYPPGTLDPSSQAYNEPQESEPHDPLTAPFRESENSQGPPGYTQPLPKLDHDSIPPAMRIFTKPLSPEALSVALPVRPPAPASSTRPSAVSQKYPSNFPAYRKEYPDAAPISQASISSAVNPPRVVEPSVPPAKPVKESFPNRNARAPPVPTKRRAEAPKSSPRTSLPEKSLKGKQTLSESTDEIGSGRDAKRKPQKPPPRKRRGSDSDSDSTPISSGRESPEGDIESQNWEERLQYIKKHLPKGIDPWAARQIFNEIVVKGDEVHWSDIAGLEQAKTALKEAVVYPFLRPDLFMGLREPARGMLLFGPPGTGKTMLARAVATESRSTFFAISASSLTSKWLGESEKLVRALFALARALAPSIIFVDEIDSLLSSRGGSSEHESTRRIKTEFLIQWSDLQRAAAGKEQSARERREGDATRVLVLAATNLPWAIDDAARRRFVRRQYIPLPEPHVREEQLRTLLNHQKHSLSEKDIKVLLEVTDGKSYHRLKRSTTDPCQVIRVQILQHWRRTQPWAHYGV